MGCRTVWYEGVWGAGFRLRGLAETNFLLIGFMFSRPLFSCFIRICGLDWFL